MNSRGLHRDPVNGIMSGVCAGIANYLQVEVWLVRLVAISFSVFGGFSIILVVYIALSLMLEKQSPSEVYQNQIKQAHTLKDRPWKRGQSMEQLLQNLEHDFEQMELDVRKMEAYVTSNAFSVNREFKKL